MTDEAERVAIAEAAMKRRAAIVSGHIWQPKLVWTLTPHREEDLRALVEASGHSPLTCLASLQLPRAALTWAGAPHWAQYCYVVLVEVRATFAGKV